MALTTPSHTSVSVSTNENEQNPRADFFHLTVCFNHQQGSLNRIQVNGRNASEFVPTAVVGMPTAVAVDWISRNLYWTNAEAGLIEVMRLDGENHYRAILLSNSGRRRDVARPISICLDPTRG